MCEIVPPPPIKDGVFLAAQLGRGHPTPPTLYFTKPLAFFFFLYGFLILFSFDFIIIIFVGI